MANDTTRPDERPTLTEQPAKRNRQPAAPAAPARMVDQSFNLAGPEEAAATLIRIGDPDFVPDNSGEGEGQRGIRGPQGQPLSEMPGVIAVSAVAAPPDIEAMRAALSMSPAERAADAALAAYEAAINPATTTVPGGVYMREDGRLVDANGRILESDPRE